jgi:diguanylate cyclase (GGDEF)-like protein
MTDLPESVKAKFSALVDDFVRQLPERYREIRDALLAARTSGRREDFSHVRLLVHKLAGSGATFGFEDLSLKSKALENIFADIDEQRVTYQNIQWDDIDSLMAEIQKECTFEVGAGCEDPDLEGSHEEGTLEELKDGDEAYSPVPRALGRMAAPGDQKKIVYLVEHDQTLALDFTDQLGFFGYSVELVHTAEEIRRHLTKFARQLLIINTNILDTYETTSYALRMVKEEYEPYLNIIFVSGKDDFDTRLKAVRAGGDAFFMLPLDISRLIDRIDDLSKVKDNAPYHILIVDDDREQVAYYALVLQQAGMITSVASDPKTVLSILVEAKPELILMDMYMPGCSGTELASIIRQQEAFVSVPIVFLSYETDREKQLAAIRHGGDDFLTKPIKSDYLIQAVSTKAERNRHLRYFMERDSLTGLLNHTHLKEQLAREVMRADRSGAPVSFAMIDADHFKNVNDTYGHLTGDRVLKSLARLLQERLRRTDIIGRYGGEEFGIILINTKPQNAVMTMNKIRESFSRIRHQVDDKGFYVSFSCGVASYPGFTDAGDICAAADQALYEAKESGRNCVVLKEGKLPS